MKNSAKTTRTAKKAAKPAAKKPRPDVYQMVTDAILARLEAGSIPWQMPWHNAGGPRNYATNRAYTGINAFLLNMVGGLPLFMTFNQAKEKGGNIRKGAKGYPVTFFSVVKKQNAETQKEEKVFILRYYTVFNVADVEGIEIKLPEGPALVEPATDETCEAIVNDWKQCPPIKQMQNQAYYSPQLDYVNMPARKQFVSTEAYYATLFHELAHATGHQSRLNRPEINEGIKFGSKAYAKEELVAEMGAAFLCAVAGINPASLDNNAAYLQSWMRRLNPDNKANFPTKEAQAAYWTEKLKEDKRLVVSAASFAQKAANMILGVQPEEVEEAQPAPVLEN